MKILKNLKEYFFRESINDYFDYERATNKELLSAHEFNLYLEESAKAEYNCMFLARNLPFIIEEIGLQYLRT